MARSWEYKVALPPVTQSEEYPYLDLDAVTDWLNEMDDEGWELYRHGESTILNRDGARQVWIFRRVIQTPA